MSNGIFSLTSNSYYDPSRSIYIKGNGNLEKKLTVKSNQFSKKAKEEIEKLGGKAEVI